MTVKREISSHGNNFEIEMKGVNGCKGRECVIPRRMH